MIRALLCLCFTASLAFAGPVVVTEEAVCSLCIDALKDADAAAWDERVHAEVVGRLEGVCDVVGPHRMEECAAVLSGLTQDMLQSLLHDMGPTDVCMAMTACPAHMEVRPQHVPKDVQPLKKDGEDACELCEAVVKALDTLLKNKTTPAEANATAYRLCESLPSQSMRDTCITFVPLIVSMILNGVDPVGACTNLGICMTVPQSSLLQVNNRNQPLSSAVACELCELLVQAVDQYLEENSTEAAINATIYKLCNDLPDSIKTTCLLLAPLVVSALSKGVDPKQACTFIKLCDGTDIQIAPPKSRDLSAGPACELCELLVQALDQYLEENSTEAAINATMYKLCNDLPDSIKTTCLSLAPLVVSALSKGVDPKQACTFVKMCDGTDLNRSQTTVDVEPLSSAVACELCELLVQAVDQYLEENSTEAAINATIYKLCNDLPSPLKDTCLGFAPEVVSALSSGVDPEQACTFLTLCTSAEKASSSQGVKVEVRSPQAMGNEVQDAAVMPQKTMQVDWCTVCKDHVGIIDQDLYREEPAVQNLLDGICHRLPPPTDQACLKAADSKFSTMWEHFLKGTASAENVCKLLEVCKN